MENGSIALTEIAAHERQQRAAELAIAHIEGVRGIRYLVELRPHTREHEVEARSKAAFPRTAKSDASHIVVKEQVGRVTLTGTVHSWAERDDATRAAWTAAGVTDVDDRITITFRRWLRLHDGNRRAMRCRRNPDTLGRQALSAQ